MDRFKSNVVVQDLNKMCSNISAISKEMAIIDRKEKYMAMRGHYKEMVIEYFRRRFVVKDYEMPNNTECTMGGNEDDLLCVSGTKMVWSPFHYPILLIGMLVNDEVFIDRGVGWNEWDPMSNEMLNYRMMQFEYIWGNTLDSMRFIRCWMSQGLRIDNDHCEFRRNDTFNIDKFTGSLHMKSKGGSTPFSDWYANEIKNIFTPCSDLIVNGILYDRPNLLLGEWMKWKYLWI